jgi:hypothetical protein
MSKYIKVTGCHDPFCPVYKFKGAVGMVCHRITYKAEIGYSPFNEIQEHIDNKTFHPDCPLDDYKESKWISVEDRLPDTCITVLAVVDREGGKIETAFHDGCSWNSVYDIVSHWQPLPQPPQDIEK